MTKEEKIQEEYGVYWKDYRYFADENGFIYQSDLFFPDTEMKKEGVEIEIISVEIKHKWSNIKWRPISLTGIENNNGWIKIESEEDLPKYNCGGCFFEFSVEGNVILVNGGNKVRNDYNFGSITHFLPLESPKPPIY